MISSLDSLLSLEKRAQEKSIIVGAVGLLKGNRADIKSIKANRDKCIVEATFNISAYDMKYLFDEYDIDYDEKRVHHSSRTEQQRQK